MNELAADPDPGADGQGAGNGGGSGGGRRSAEPDPKPTAKKKRPGRKSGQVYDFDVDENGRPVPLDVARVYTGEDEPDLVEYDDEDDDGGGGDD